MRTGNPELAREINYTLILDLLRAKSPISRVEISKALNLSKVTVSTIVNALVMDGLIVEIGEGIGAEKGGRKPILLALNHSCRYVVGVDIGTTNTAIAIGNLGGEIINKTQRPTSRDRSFNRVFDQVACLVNEIIDVTGIERGKVLGLGVSVPGLVETQSGIIRLSPDLNWMNVAINSLLSEQTDLDVVSENCTRAMLLGEKLYGKAKDEKNVFYVNLGYGVGSAIMINNEIYSSHSEFGHTFVSEKPVQCHCGNFGCLEAVASGNAIERMANNSCNNSKKWISAKMAADAAKNGDAKLIKIFDKVGMYLGRAISMAANLFNPDKIILGGGVTLCGKLLLEPLKKEYENHIMSGIKSHSMIEISSLGLDAGAFGAIALALNKFIFKPEKIHSF
jgi:glucokinase-like ROK family protein